MTPIFLAFVDAAEKRLLLTCDYGGYTREICVHAVGWKDGEEQAMAYQFAGGSSSTLPKHGDWRCLKLSDVSRVSTRTGPWVPRGRYTRRQGCVDRIYYEIDD